MSLDGLVRDLEVLVDEDAVFERVERCTLALANELVRRVLERKLQQLAGGFTDEIAFQGERYRRHLAGTVEYHSLCGALRVQRYSYRQTGVRNGPTVVPLELQAGLIEDATPALAFSVAQGYAKMPSRHYEEEMAAAFRCVPSRSTLERMGKRFGGVAKRIVAAVEPTLRAAEALPPGARSISVGLDRASVPMIEERPPTTAPVTPRKRRTKAYARKPPHPFDVAYRMAYVGTVTVHDEQGTALRTWRFAATPEEQAEELVERVLTEIKHLRRRKRMPIVMVQDGAPELWGLLWTAFTRHQLKADYQIIDRYHFDEHLSRALEILIVDKEERAQLLTSWRHDLDRSDRAIVHIAALLEREEGACRMISRREKRVRVPSTRYARVLSNQLLNELALHCGYITGHQRRLRYDA